MTENPAFQARISERHTCDVAVNACTTLSNRPARVVDVSLHGAQVRIDQPYETGDRIHLDIDGEFIWATVQWTEIDRMGVKFISPIRSDHRLMVIVGDQVRKRNAGMRPAGMRTFGRRAA